MGPSPDFRLERVRALRERAEDLARERYAASLQHQLAGEAMLAAADAQVDGALEAHRSTLVSRPVAGTELVALQGFRDRTLRARADAHREQQQREAQLHASRQSLTAASRDREALEKLKVRHAQAWAVHERRLDAQATDEMAISQHRRRSAAPAPASDGARG